MEPHIDDSALAQLADGTLSGVEARAARDHLAECRSCLAAYVDAVRYRAAWLADPEEFRLAEADLSFAELPRRRGQAGEPGRRTAISGRHALVATLVVALAVAVIVPWRPAAPTLSVRLAPPTLEAAARSAGGGLVIPGAQAHADDTRPELRSGAPAISLDLDSELRAAIAAYEGGSRGPEAGGRVVGALLAQGDIAAANDYAREALRAHPDDVPILVLASVAAARANDLAEAERLLLRAARRAPRDPIVALDLGLILCRQGRAPESREWLERASASSVAPVASRARRELKSCAGGSQAPRPDPLP